MIPMRPYSIAVIEDDEGVLELLTELVDSVDGVRAKGFSNPIKALEAIENEKIRVVITDIHMPEMFRDDVLRECMKMKQGISVYVVTGVQKVLIADRCMNNGARGILTKPVASQDIIRLVQDSIKHLDHWASLIRNYGKRHQLY